MSPVLPISIFGPIKTRRGLETRVMTTLHAWIETYLREVERQEEFGRELPNPRSYTRRTEFDKFPEDQLPAVIVVSPGFARPPRKEGDGLITGFYTLAVVVVASAPDPVTVRDNLDIYTAAVRAIMLQKRSHGQYADNVEYLNETYDTGPEEQSRTLAASTLELVVEVSDIADWSGGPITNLPPDPDTQPGTEWPTVDVAHATIHLVADADDFDAYRMG